MSPITPDVLPQLLRMGDILLRALGTRLLAAVALLMTCGLFAWAMERGTWMSFGVAGAFALCVLWPVLAVAWLVRRDS